jgi:uncharacterized membrane protein
MRHAFALAAVFALTGCHSDAGGEAAKQPGDAGTAPWSAIGVSETLHFTGTEPFWGGEAIGNALTWKTPENQAGTQIPVTRFAGRNGMGLSGTLGGQPFEMAVSEAPCSDGMSDRGYPFTVTVRTGGKSLRGCGWTDQHPPTGPGR